MVNFFHRHRNSIFGMIFSLSVFAIISLALVFTNILDGIERNSLDFRFFIRDTHEKTKNLKIFGVQKEKIEKVTKNEEISDDIVILGIDLETIREFDSYNVHWPFPWSYHKKVLDFISTGNPNTVMFDIMFLDHKNYEEDFAYSINKAGNVFIDYEFVKKGNYKKAFDIEDRIKILDNYSWEADPKDNTQPWVEEVDPPTPLLSAASKGLGFANILDDPDHVNRKMPLLIKFNGRYYPSISLVTAMNYFGITKNDVEINYSKYIKLKNIPLEKMKKPNPEREIKIPIDERGFMDINFVGGTGSFYNLSYWYFNKDGELEKDSFKNKIILIGAYSVSGIATDMKKSPFGETFGIEHQASAINTIIMQDFLVKLTDKENILIMLLIALIIGLILPKINMIGAVAFTVISIVGYAITSYALFDSKNIIMSFSTPMIQIALTYTIIVVVRYLTEQKEKKYIKQTFSKFVSKTVVDDLLKHPDKVKLGGEKKILSVLFSDVRGFTTISERLTPEALVVHLNDYLQAMTDIVFKYNGTLDKYVGDEIMAFWGAPIPQEDHALLACKAAIQMIDDLEVLNKTWEAQGKPRLDIGIGINSGIMVVGNMGSHSRMDYTLMGDNVNLGARLEGTNKTYGTRIIISENTYELVKNQVIVRELDLIRVKGKLNPVTIYELVDVINN